MSKVIEVVIDSSGKTTIQTKGFAGSECREVSKFLEQALGVQTSEQLTAEFYNPQSLQQQTNQQSAKG